MIVSLNNIFIFLNTNYTFYLNIPFVFLKIKIMPYTKSIFGICALLFSIASFAQEETPKAITITDVQLYSGMNIYPVSSISLNEMKAFAPNSTILAKDFTGFHNANYHSVYSNQSFSALLGINFKNKPNRQLRVGLNYLSKTNFTGSAGREDNYPYDTLTSSQTGQQYFLDSTNSKHVYMSQEMEQLSLDASFIFRTDVEARWSFHGGFGLLLGYSFNAVTYISYSANSSMASYTSEYDNSNNDSEHEQFRNKNFLITAVYLPLGVDFRIGKDNKFWSRIHLFYELRPTMSIASIPEWQTVTQFSFTQGLGLKIKW